MSDKKTSDDKFDNKKLSDKKLFHKNLLGAIDDLINKRWKDPQDNKIVHIPIKAIEIAPSLNGIEHEFINKVHKDKSLIIISDKFTYEVLASRVFKQAKKHNLNIKEHIWQNPRSSIKGVEEIKDIIKPYDAVIAVGSGTISDSVKYATFLDKKEYSVFPTTPMNAYSTPTASISFDGFKRSLGAHSAKGLFFDLDIISNCPKNMIAAAFADVICRTTAQVDWLMSHMLFDTPYKQTPYTLLAYDEKEMIKQAPNFLKGDFHALSVLNRICIIMGLGTGFTGTTHCGSMAEHMMSHHIDMFASPHPKSSHGEQVGVATMSMNYIHNKILNSKTPPKLYPTKFPKERLVKRYGKDKANMMEEQTNLKALDEKKADYVNEKFTNEWESFRATLKEVMLPFETLKAAMSSAKAKMSASDLGLDIDFYKTTLQDARFLRDRFSMLDIVDDANMIDDFLHLAH